MKETKFLQVPSEKILLSLVSMIYASYEKALIGNETSLILSPDSDFFKFFGKSGARKFRSRSAKPAAKKN